MKTPALRSVLMASGFVVALGLLVASQLLYWQSNTRFPSHDTDYQWTFAVQTSDEPLSFTQNGKPAGLVVDIARAAFEHGNIKARLLPMSLHDAYRAFDEGRVDGIVNVVEPSLPSADFDFSAPIGQDQFLVYHRKGDKPINFDYLGLESLKKHHIAVEDKSVADSRLSSMKDLSLHRYFSAKQAILSVLQGENDVYIGSALVTDYLLRDSQFSLINTTLVADPTPFVSVQNRIAVAKDNLDLLYRVNRGLRAIRQNGELHHLQGYWTVRAFDQIGREKRLTGLVGTTLSMLLLLVIAFYWRFAKLRHMNRRILQEQRAKDQFISHMAHEFRTPLNTLNSLLAIPEGKIPFESFKNKLNTCARHLNGLTSNVLDYERARRGLLQTDYQAGALVHELRQTLSLFDSVAKITSTQVKLTVDDNLPEVVMLDWRLLQQVLVNLLDNAFKFAGGGTVTLQVSSQSGGHIKFKVKDNGVGIATDDLNKVFEVFFQAGAKGDDRSVQGCGLGLSVARSFVLAMDGQLSVQSSLGNGAEFLVELPLILPTRSTMQGFRESISLVQTDFSRQLEGLTLMIVDDHVLNLRINSKLFQARGATVHIARSGNDALESLLVLLKKDEKPDVILMDLQMPGMDGYTCIEQINTLFGEKFVEIFAFTASHDLAIHERLQKLGVHEVVFKPFDMDQVCTNILSRLKSKQSNQEILTKEIMNS